MKRVLAAAAALVLVSAGAVATLAPAAADEVWIQAFQRPGQDVVCQAPADETAWQASFGGQQEWTPSWAQWANHGRGGWVCQRTIEWAKGSAAAAAASASAICAAIDKGHFYSFGPSRIIAPATTGFSDSACSIPEPASEVGVYFVYADSAPVAAALCASVDPGGRPEAGWDDPNVWSCGA